MTDANRIEPAPTPASELPPRAAAPEPPLWRQMNLLATTSTVLVVSGVALWRASDERGWRESLAIGSTLALYPVSLALLAGRARGAVRLPSFVGAGLAAAGVGQLIHGRFMFDRAVGVAAATGAFVGLAHWAAARAWTRLIGNEFV